MNIDTEKICYFSSSREDVFGCCVRAVRRKTFLPFGKICDKFSDTEGVSKSAVEVGGPSREMFRFPLNFVMECQMFCGGKKNFMLRLDV